MEPRTLAKEAGFKTVTELARALQISVPSISQWKRVPAERAAQIAELSKGRLTLEMLRPDLFPKKGKRS